LRIGHLSQAVAELDGTERVLDSVNRLKRETKLATGQEASASSLLEEFGFTGEKLVTRIGDLSGGEQRRLQFLRLLMGEPNVLLLDEPTNDLDIDTLTVIEDYLDTWPGTLIVVTHDRYFVERVCDVTYALLGDGRCVLLPGGIDEYLALRRRRQAVPAAPVPTAASTTARASAAARQARKDLARVENLLAKTTVRIEKLHHAMSEHAADYAKLVSLGEELSAAEAQHEQLEAQWLELVELLEG
jgi:ATP-binding cassette subfamily F protein uup